MPKDKHKKGDRKKKASKKTSQLAIRIEKDERDDFVNLCETLDTSAAREIRRFMREFVAAHAPSPAAADDPAPTVTEAGPAAPEADVPAAEPVRKRRTRTTKASAEDAPAKPEADAPAAEPIRKRRTRTTTAPAEDAPAKPRRRSVRAKVAETAAPVEIAPPPPRRTRRPPRAKAAE